MLKMYQVDAFADQLFEGNPAAICPLTEWLPDKVMQQIAIENNLSETAFFIPKGKNFHLRWFTPAFEVDLCGHATLGTAHVLFQHLDYKGSSIVFHTRVGELLVKNNGTTYAMNFPADELKETPTPSIIQEALKLNPILTFIGREDYMTVVESQEIIENLRPDFRKISQLGARGLIVTAAGREVDFVSRCFFPQAGVDEDPATGSAHTTMAPYWAKKLNKNDLTAIQLSKRKGHLRCILKGDRVEIHGKAVTYMIGEIKY